jgi:hypothetical protein
MGKNELLLCVFIPMQVMLIAAFILVAAIRKRMRSNHPACYMRIMGPPVFLRTWRLARFVFCREHLGLADKKLSRMCDLCVGSFALVSILSIPVFILMPQGGINYP